MTVRRFYCDQVDCGACTFVEQVPGLAERHARRSVGLSEALVAVALALAGRPGARLAAALGMAVGRSTLLRLIRALPDPPIGRVTVLGVNEFALRRRHHYATVLVDMGCHRPVDVLTGRDARDFAGWLRAHPGVKVVCRDRAGGYADGARAGAPSAVQVADRWHLWDNLCQHVERLVAAHHTCLPDPAVSPPTGRPDPDPADQVVKSWPATVRVEHTRQRHAQIHEVSNQGLSMDALARRLDLNFKTVRRYLDADDVDALLAGGVRSSVLDPFKPYLHSRLAAGERRATALLREIVGQGYTGGYQTLRRYVRPLRCVEAAGLTNRGAPSEKKVAGWITGLPSRLEPGDATRLRAIWTRCPELDSAVGHVAGFARMIKDLSGDVNTLTKWLGAVDADVPALRSFSAGVRRDMDAVVAGLTLPYNSGPVEGTVTRIKQLKTAMYGRAKPDLLRKRILLA